MRTYLFSIVALLTLLTGVGSPPSAIAGFAEQAIVRTVTGSGRGDGRLSTSASVIQVNALATDSRGNIYIVDRFDHRVRRIDRRTGIISTIAGTGIAGNGPNNAPGETVALNFPSDVSVDAQDRVVIADTFNFVLRRYDPRTGVVSIIAGTGSCCTSGDGGLATRANLNAPLGVHVAPNQDIYLSEGSVVRRVRAQDGVIEPVAGVFGQSGQTGDGGPAVEATLGLPTFLATDGAGQLYINDLTGEDLRVVDLESGIIDTLISVDVNGNRLPLTDARAMQFDTDSGRLLVIEDPGYYRIDPDSGSAELVDLDLLAANSLAITPGGNLLISNLAREVFSLDEQSGARRSLVTSVQPAECSETLDAALLFSPKGIAVGPDGLVYVADQSLGFVASIDEVAGTVTAVAGRRGALSSIVTGDGGDAIDAVLAVIVDIAFDTEGRLLIATSSAIRRVDLQMGTIRTIAGIGSMSPDQTSDPMAASFFEVTSIAAAGGDYFIGLPNALYRISDNASVLERVAGNSTPGFSGDGGPATQALMDSVNGLAADAEGNLYVSDSGNNRIRRIDAQTGVIATVAGTGEFFPVGDGGPALEAGLSLPQGIALSRDGQTLFIAESGRIRAVNLRTGLIDTLAGTGESGASGDGGPASQAQLNIPVRMAEDRFGNLYFSELGRQRVRVIERLGSGVRLPFEIDPGDAFGSAISASGRRFAVGIPSDANTPRGSGTVAIYRNDDCRLVLEDRIVPPQQLALRGFGRSITLDGDNLVVGGLSLETDSKGLTSLQAALFERVGTAWQFKQPIGSASSAPDDAFGAAVAMDGNTMVVGAPQADDGTGAAYVFTNEGGLWTEQLRVGGQAPGDGFGSAVDVKGDMMAVGAPGSQVSDGTTGSVSLYDQIASNLNPNFNPIAQVTSPGESLTQGFGASVALSETAMIVGAPDSDDDTGSVYLFDATGANAIQLAAGDLNSGARLGAAVDIDETVAFVGAPGLTDASGGRGGVFGFSLDDVGEVLAKGGAATSPLQKIDPAFYQQGLGASVSVANGRAFAGAPETGGNRGDAVALQLIANLGAASGLWFDPELEGEGFNIVTTTSGAFVYYYGYTGSGERLWLVSNAIPSLGFGEPVSVDMFDSSGGTFASPISSSQGIEPWGRLQITYDTTTSAVIELFGVEGSKVSRTVRLVDARGADGGFSGLWFDPELEGEGYNVIASSVGTIVYYYGFSASGERLWLVSNVITDPLGTTPVSVTLFEAQGGTFASPAPSAESLSEWGTLTLSFSDCDHARFEISGSDGEKTSNTVRLAGISGQVCDLALAR